jgi:hypothetical protein
MHTREHFISYTLIVQSAAVVKGLGGVSVTPIGKGTVRIRCKIKGKSRAVNLTNMYHVPNGGVNLILVGQLFQVGATIDFTPQSCQIKTKNKVLTTISKNGCWFIDKLRNKQKDNSAEAILLGYEEDHIYRLLTKQGLIRASTVRFAAEKRRLKDVGDKLPAKRSCDQLGLDLWGPIHTISQDTSGNCECSDCQH